MANAPRCLMDGLRRDQCGAILVPALVMGAVMTGALFYVAAAGDAIIFRTELQNAADVTSFKSAVWHARGMNAVASLNQLMVTALAVFAVLRMARIVVLVVPPLFPAQGALQTAETGAFRILKPTLMVVEAAQTAVSGAVPFVALLDAKNTPTRADTIWPLAVSLVPPPVTSIVDGRDHVRRPSAGAGALPIEEGTFGMLCGKSAVAVPNLIFSLIEELPLPGWLTGFLDGWISPLLDDVLPKVFGIGDGVFCQPLEGGATQLLSFLGKEACKEAEDKASGDAEEQERREAERQGGQADQAEPQGSADRGGRNGSRRGRNGRSGGQETSACDAADNALDTAKQGTMFDVKPAVMWHAMKNGNPATHVWTWALGSSTLLPTLRRGVAIADKGREPNVDTDDKAVAMSEFYFNCDTEWDAKCVEDAPWAPNWTARVRRFRHPLDELKTIGLSTPLEMLESLKAPLNETVTDLIGGYLHDRTGIPEENMATKWIGDQVAKLPILKQASEALSNAVIKAESATGLDKLLQPRRYVEERRIH